MADVRVPSSVLVVGSVVLVVAVAVAAYFAGKSQRAEPAPVLIGPSSHVADPPALTAQGAGPTPSATAPVASLPTAPPTPGAEAPASPPPPTTPPPPTVVPNADPERAAVSRYFVDLDRATATVKPAGDPQSIAMAALQQDPNGGSGVTSLIADQQRLRDAVAGVYAPSSCSEHKSKTLDVIDEGESLLKDLSSAMKSSDQTTLTKIAVRAHALEDKTKAVDALAAQVRTHYGL